MHKQPALVALTFLFLVVPEASQAYVGPGAGLSLLGALWALLAAVGTAIVFVIAWPIRRMRRRKREAREREEAQQSERGESPQRDQPPAARPPPRDRQEDASRLQRQ